MDGVDGPSSSPPILSSPSVHPPTETLSPHFASYPSTACLSPSVYSDVVNFDVSNGITTSSEYRGPFRSEKPLVNRGDGISIPSSESVAELHWQISMLDQQELDLKQRRLQIGAQLSGRGHPDFVGKPSPGDSN